MHNLLLSAITQMSTLVLKIAQVTGVEMQQKMNVEFVEEMALLMVHVIVTVMSISVVAVEKQLQKKTSIVMEIALLIQIVTVSVEEMLFSIIVRHARQVVIF